MVGPRLLQVPSPADAAACQQIEHVQALVLLLLLALTAVHHS